MSCLLYSLMECTNYQMRPNKIAFCVLHVLTYLLKEFVAILIQRISWIKKNIHTRFAFYTLFYIVVALYIIINISRKINIVLWYNRNWRLNLIQLLC